jgi:hypothetical protein
MVLVIINDTMLERFKKIILFSTLSLLMTSPGIAFADYYGEWDYHGSGRDHPYSAYIDRANYIGYADYTLAEPAYVDAGSYIAQVPVSPAVVQNEFTVNIPNDHGGYTAVVIKRSGNGFVGPQGEYYPEFPKVFQLKLMYGK